MLSRKVEQMIKNKKDIDWPFKKIMEFLNTADLVVANMESPILKNGVVDKQISQCGNQKHHGHCGSRCIFKTDPMMISALLKANIKMVSVANNHIFDYGISGYLKTINYLINNGINPIGFDYMPIIETEEGQIGFLAYCYTNVDMKSNDYNLLLSQIKQDLNQLSHCDVKIILIHGGEEYHTKPTNLQKKIARHIIDNGGDLVIGHHPHVKQTIEIYRNKYIFYSIGNFIFDQDWDSSKKTRNSYSIKIKIKNGMINQYELYNIFINDEYQPMIISDGIILEKP